MKQVNTLICCVLTKTKCHCVHRPGSVAGIAQDTDQQDRCVEAARKVE